MTTKSDDPSGAPRDGPVRRPTIYDVAAAAGVAPSTVSRTFSRPGRVSAESAALVRRVAEEIGYRADPLARSGPVVGSSLIAIVVADVTNPYFFDLLRGAEEEAAAADYTLLVADVQESAQAEKRVLERILPMVAGVVLATSRLSDSAIRMAARQKPTVLLNRSMSDVSSVTSDNGGGMVQAVEHLGRLGHVSVSYAGGPEASWANGIRWHALSEASRQHGMKARRRGPFEPTQAGGLAAANDLASSQATAVIAYNDLMAIGLLRGLQSLGARVPDDVSVLGFDNIFGSDFCTPPLTTVAAPLRQLGAVAIETLIADLRGTTVRRPSDASGALKTALLPTQLIIRESTGPARAGRRWLDVSRLRDR
ncbi:LacI family DNA-binding transcriptional regulator [Rathayibacter festucae]|uniref:LacI family DNA-binding transcriptional regulator n=1 Tax=Rathayibacter festucae TaxID=110937 RepID=UPI002A6AE760|nr:LacI family DNA-binding transcriptional regulator [Rathayibacter festucae]MDY0914540.1 LacI family DNA-binding transcriptional regulator [Rathayibacter festucae]